MNAVATAIWSIYVPTDDQPWNLRRAHHLHRRAGLGANWRLLQRDLADGPDAAVGHLLAGDRPVDDFDSLQNLIGEAAVGSGDINRLKAWWFYRMLFSGDPLTERMTLMWHNHFATSNSKVSDVAMMKRQNDRIRTYAVAKFGDLLRAVVKDAAMMIWLDAKANRKEQPNENLARELMELFTLGVSHYDESDVKEVARALTGWTNRDGQFTQVEAYHDDGVKTLLGHEGRFDGDDVLDILIQQDATATRIAARLCETFFGEHVASPEHVDSLAEGLRRNDLDIRWAVETILRSDLFFADDNIGTQVLGPIELMVGQLRALELLDPPPSTLLLAEWSAKLGQDLFDPPNVFGWPGGRAWLSTRTVIGRSNFTSTMLRGRLHRTDKPMNTTALARKHGFDDANEQASFFSQLLFGNDQHVGSVEQMLNHPQSHLG